VKSAIPALYTSSLRKHFLREIILNLESSEGSKVRYFIEDELAQLERMNSSRLRSSSRYS
jgi:hypothetical protein